MCRPYRLADYEAWATVYASDQEALSELMGRKPPYDRAPDRCAFEEFYVEKQNLIADRTGYWAGVFVDDVFVGEVSTMLRDEECGFPDFWETGYWIAKQYRGNGYAGEATRLLLDRILRVWQGGLAVFYVRPSNSSSARVLEKLNVKQESSFDVPSSLQRDGYDIWTLTAQEWQSHTFAHSNT